jgi:hypothetical protein
MFLVRLQNELLNNKREEIIEEAEDECGNDGNSNNQNGKGDRGVPGRPADVLELGARLDDVITEF